MDPNSTYDNAEICTLIDKARGQRSLSEYGRACGVSAAHISRIYSGICRPTRKLCIKLADESAKRGFSEKQFLNAAGYIDESIGESNLMSPIWHSISFPKGLEEAVYVGSVAKALGKCGYTYQLLPKAGESGDNMTTDFSFAVEQDETVVRWNFYGEAVVTVSSSVLMDTFYYFMGRLMSCKQKDSEKHTLLLRDAGMFERIKQSLGEVTPRADLSVALFDLQTMEIVDEIILGSGSKPALLLK